MSDHLSRIHRTIWIIGIAPETTTSLIAAGAVLGGVLAGGLVTLLTTAYFERRRDVHDVRQARRLVADELRTVWTDADGLVSERTYPIRLPPERVFFPSKQWITNRAMLARHLDDESWDPLSTFMDTIATARALVELGYKGWARQSPRRGFGTSPKYAI